MSMKDDTTRLRHILDAARQASDFLGTVSREEIRNDRKLAYALIKCIEIIGEAAANLTSDLQKKNPRVPWAQVVGMRNRLVHGYFEIDYELVWDTVVDDLPALVSQIQEILIGLKQNEEK